MNDDSVSDHTRTVYHKTAICGKTRKLQMSVDYFFSSAA